MEYLEKESGCTSSMIFYNTTLHNYYAKRGYTVGENLETVMKSLVPAEKRTNDNDFLRIKDEYYYNKKTITELINDAGKYMAFELNCYPHNVERNIDVVFQRILETLKIQGKKYIFTYYPEPDDILHAKSLKSQKAVEEIKKINAKVEEYSKLILQHEKTMLIIVADHGHLISEQKKNS